jgi:hypothetical protein
MFYFEFGLNNFEFGLNNNITKIIHEYSYGDGWSAKYEYIYDSDGYPTKQIGDRGFVTEYKYK